MKFVGTKDYIATEDLKVAVNAAVTLERPLLVKGEPGTGKTELARRAAARISPLVATELAQIDGALDAAIAKGDVTGYLSLNYRFHSALYAQANAPIMAELAERLWLRFGPSLRVVCGRFGTQNLPDRHKDLLAALRRRDAEAASVAMGQDIDQGMEQVAAVLEPRT